VEVILPKNDIEFLADKKLFSIALNNLILNGIQAIDGKGILDVTVEEKDSVRVLSKINTFINVILKYLKNYLLEINYQKNKN